MVSKCIHSYLSNHAQSTDMAKKVRNLVNIQIVYADCGGDRAQNVTAYSQTQ